MTFGWRRTLAIIGATVGAVLTSSVAIATLIVTQHQAMRESANVERAAIRGELAAFRESANAEHAAMRESASEQHAALRGEIASLRADVVEIRDDIRVIRSDLADLGERVARIEVHAGVTAENR